MIKVYIDDVSNYLKEDLFLCAEELPLFRKKKIATLKLEKDKLLSIVSGKLLMKAFSYFNIDCSNVKTTKEGKEYIEGSKYHYSLSHSGNKVVLVISNHVVGCDIEEIKERDLNIANRFFDEDEIKLIASSKDPNLEFIKIWTIKESYLKATGEGLLAPLNSVQIKKRLNSYFISDSNYKVKFVKKIDNYVISLVIKRS